MYDRALYCHHGTHSVRGKRRQSRTCLNCQQARCLGRGGFAHGLGHAVMENGDRRLRLCCSGLVRGLTQRWMTAGRVSQKMSLPGEEKKTAPDSHPRNNKYTTTKVRRRSGATRLGHHGGVHSATIPTEALGARGSQLHIPAARSSLPGPA